MVQQASISRGRSKLLWGVLSLMIVLSFTLVACGGSNNPSTGTVYINAKPGELNGQDAPQLDKFWFSNSKTNQTFATSYSANLAPGGTVTWINEGDDPQELTITGPNNYNTSHTITAAGQGASTTSIQLPTATGDYTFITNPTNAPKRDGARGGIIHVG
jgi:plastocyanin